MRAGKSIWVPKPDRVCWLSEKEELNFGELVQNSGGVVWQCVKTRGFCTLPARFEGVEFWHFGGVSVAICKKHGEFAVFYCVLGHALCARILAESSFARKCLERVGRLLTQN